MLKFFKTSLRSRITLAGFVCMGLCFFFTSELFAQSEEAETTATVSRSSEEKEKKEEKLPVEQKEKKSDELQEAEEEPKKSSYALQETTYAVTLQESNDEEFSKFDKMNSPKDLQLGKALRQVASTLGIVEGEEREARIEGILRKMAETEAAEANRDSNYEEEFDFIPRNPNFDPAGNLINTGSEEE